MKSLSKRHKVLRVNDAYSIIRQISWDIKQITDQFPVSDLKEDELDDYLFMGKDFIENTKSALYLLEDCLKDIKL
jgi:hypothetical protein